MYYLDKEYPKKFNYTDRGSNILKAISQYWYYYKRFCESTDDKSDCDSFVGTPLNLYLLANYFTTEIKDVSKNTNEWDLDINNFAIFERFLETKLEKIRFQENKKVPISYPNNKKLLKKEKADFYSYA